MEVMVESEDSEIAMEFSYHGDKYLAFYVDGRVSVLGVQFTREEATSILRNLRHDYL